MLVILGNIVMVVCKVNFVNVENTNRYVLPMVDEDEAIEIVVLLVAILAVIRNRMMMSLLLKRCKVTLVKVIIA